MALRHAVSQATTSIRRLPSRASVIRFECSLLHRGGLRMVHETKIGGQNGSQATVPKGLARTWVDWRMTCLF